MSSPMSSPTGIVNVPAQSQKNVTSTLRQIRPSAFARKQSADSAKDGGKSIINEDKGPPVIDNLTATINSVAENVKSPTRDDATGHAPLGDVLSGTQNLNLNKRPNLTIFQKNKPSVVAEPVKKPSPAKKKNKKDENKMDLWELMKSAGMFFFLNVFFRFEINFFFELGIGDEEFEEAGPSEIPQDNVEIAADSELLAQLQNSQALQV